jgi:hypothetical protein
MYINKDENAHRFALSGGEREREWNKNYDKKVEHKKNANANLKIITPNFSNTAICAFEI